MGNFGLDIPWMPIEPADPSGSDMVDVGKVRRKWLDVAYAGQSPSQVLDIYLPDKGKGPFPTYVFIHGGAFIAGDKARGAEPLPVSAGSFPPIRR